MDFVRKLVRSSSSYQSQPTQSNNLGLLTLCSQFRDAYKLSPGTSEAEEKLYAVFPLFLQVFKSSPPHDMKEKFGDVLAFSTRASSLMVTEIRRRASNKSTEQASVDIANFLATNENRNRGWTLLNVLSLLAAGDQTIIEKMTEAHLPSTLVKCLYLFFDLPPQGVDQTYTVSAERNEMLQKVFVQTLVRLCGHLQPAEELASKGDLALLFSAVTSWCSPHNKNWRNAASDVLITISRHSFSPNVIQHIRGKRCIQTCIDNLWRTVSVEGTSAASLYVDLTDQLLCLLRFLNNTSEITQALLKDFREHQGYIFIGEFLLRLETFAIESDRHKRALLSMVGSIEKLTTCGFQDLILDSVAHQSFQTNFIPPVPIGKGESVRNVEAFELLETVFLRSRTTLLTRAVLDAVFAVYCRDPANYFILSSLNTMSSFSERLPSKHPEIYPQYFAIFEYITLTVGFIPRKELVSISLLLKTDSNIECSVACLKSLQKLLSSSVTTYREVFREVGILEMLIKCLQRYSSLLKACTASQSDDNIQQVDEEHHAFGRLTMDVLVEMIQGSSTNAGIFRETGGARCAYNTLSYPDCRRSALSLVEALILQPASDGNDDDVVTLLGLLSTVSLKEIQLKIDMLKSVYKVVKKSKMISIMFRNAGGIIAIISILLKMEGYLSFEPSELWNDRSLDGFVLLEILFHILTVILSLPSNEKYFENEVGCAALTDAIKNLGCFSRTPILNAQANKGVALDKPAFLRESLQMQEYPADDQLDSATVCMRKILCLFKLVYMSACDLFKDEVQEKIEKLQHSISTCSTFSDDSIRSTQDLPRGHILHPNILKVFIQLIPCLSVQELDQTLLLSLQFYLIEEVNLVLNNERNEQIACEVGLLSTLLTSFDEILSRDDQPLNHACQRTLERLATQSISPQELRMLLRVGKPLKCDNLLVSNGVVALSRVKSLVSVSTPRNVGMISDISSSYKAPPSFIEFDMSMQGNSHLFIPFLFPHSASNSASANASSSAERLFPPSHGVAVALWFYVESFCRHQLHPVRLLTIERQVIATNHNFNCLSITISPRRKRLIVSTSERNVNNLVPGSLDYGDSKETVGFNLEHLCAEGQWHHLQVVVQRATVLKQSTVTASFNGSILGISKIRYINTCPGGASQQSLNSPVAVHGWVGTRPQLGTHSSLVWRLGSLRVFDETSSLVPNISTLQTKLGPNYVGNYQDVLLPDGSSGGAFLEDHLCFSLLPTSVESITPSMVQRAQMMFDLKVLAVKMDIDIQEDLSSLDFYPNTCIHAPGPARSFGAFAVGRKYSDSPRCFLPKGVGRVLQDVGGISVSLYLVDMANDVEGLYAAVKFLVCVLKSDCRATKEMERSNGYQALGMLLKDKKHLLNSHILHLTFSIAGTVDTGQDRNSSVTNLPAFESLLSDLEIWHNAPQELHKSLFDHFYELLTESSDAKSIHAIMTGFNFIQRCVHFLYSDATLSYLTVTTVIKVVHVMFTIDARKQDLLCFGQFAVSLISATGVLEKDVVLGEAAQDFAESSTKGKVDEKTLSKRSIHFRRIVLEVIAKCIASSEEDVTFCEALETHLGLDWILLFMQSDLHHSTVTTALHLLFTILQRSYTITSSSSNPNISATALQAPALPVYSTPLTLIDRFRSGENFGGWLQGTSVLMEKKEDSLLGFNVRSISDFTTDRYHQSVLLEAVPVPGFLALQHLVSAHASSQPILKLLLQFLVGRYGVICGFDEFSPPEIARYYKATGSSKLGENRRTLSLEVSQILNSMLRQLLHQNWAHLDKCSPVRNDPNTLIEAFEYAYNHDTSGLSYLFATPEFLTSFIVTLFPPDNVVSLTSETSSKDVLSLEGLFPAYPSSDMKLSNHPSIKSLYLFLCKILWDSTTAVRNKSSLIIDVFLELPTDKSNSCCIPEYITDIIIHIIDYCVPNLADLIKSSHCSTTISYMVSRIVDKVWQGYYTDECKKIFQFIIHLISSYHHKLSSQVLGALYRSLFRLILFQLSRKHSTISDQMVLQGVLHSLTTYRSVVFDSKFRDIPLYSCLCHCLFMVSGDSAGKDFGLEADQRLTTWHVTEASKQSPVTPEAPEPRKPGTPVSPVEKGQGLLNNAAARVWSELMTSRKEFLADAFKVSFPDSGTEQENFDSARVLIREASSKAWTNYLLLEKKATLSGAKESPQQQKLMKRMSNVVGFGAGKKLKKDFVCKLGKNITIQVLKEPRVKRAFLLFFEERLAYLNFKSQTTNGDADASPPKDVDAANRSTSPFEWMTKRRASSLSSEHASSLPSTPTMESPVKIVVNLLDEFKKDMELALRLRDVFILQEEDRFIILQDSHMWTLNHISVVQSLVRLQCNEREQEESHLKRFTQKEWKSTTSELTRECGVWGPEEEEGLTKWTLDSTEGPCRMRKRMMKDETFYVRYPYRTRFDSSTPKHKKPTSKDSLEYYRRVNRLSPYYNGESEVKNEQNNPLPTAVSGNLKPVQEAESSSDELDNEEAVILNLCLKCQPSQPSATMKVNTLSGKEALSCDICGLTLGQDGAESGNCDPESSSGDKTTVDAGTADSRSDSPAIAKSDNMTGPATDGTSPAPSEPSGTPKRQANGLVSSDSMVSLAEPNPLEKDKQDNQTILKLLEKGEKIRQMFRVARVQGLDVHEGLLLFGQDHYYIIDGFTMMKSKEIRDIATLPGEHEPIIPSSTRHSQDNAKNEAAFSDRMCSKFPYSDIREVHKRRYLLQNIALEVFNKDGRNCLLVFPQGSRAKVFSKFTSYAPAQFDRGKDSIVGQRSGLSVEQLGPPGWFGLIGEKTVTSRWERGEISNFQYLMYLNTLAGRSYNDLMQYPVFPWIIADYDSEVLDLTKPETFRDLSKPMGAQTPSRLEQYNKRYKDWEELGGIDTPPYHYGTHYSSAMIVASYLVRMEPFTQHFLRLQGGHFDLADRMFHSIKDSWTSASQKNMADVKELIPEFFYLPEFILNTNKFDLGQKQNGVHLDDVILPTWARGSIHEFIRAHREALECDYVSSHLNEWIDLIFGYKQKGDAALDAHNVFHHLFYEGEVDIYSIKDPLKRNATIGFINNFGQIPKQLFKRPHPQKKCKTDGGSGSPGGSKVFYKHIENLTTTTSPLKEIHDPVGHIVAHDKGVSVTEQGKVLIPSQHTRYLSFGHKDRSIRIGNYESDRPAQIFENLDCDEITCAAMATENVLVTGNKSTVVHVWQVPTVRDRNKSVELMKSLYGHTMAVSSVAVCASYGIIVSGSEDGSCILWDLNHLVFVRQLHHHQDSSISNICINEKSGSIVTSSDTNLYLWSINGQLIACASALSSNARSQRITSVSFSKLNEWDPDSVIVTGHSDGHLRFWRLEHVQVPETASLVDFQMYADTNSKKPPPAMHHLINACKTPDTLSLASVGDVAELPWNDVSKVELSNQEMPPKKEQTTADTFNLKWKEQLVLKGKIELPTCHSKTRGSYVPAVSYIAMSKNHETLYTGDEAGRVFSWSCG